MFFPVKWRVGCDLTPRGGPLLWSVIRFDIPGVRQHFGALFEEFRLLVEQSLRIVEPELDCDTPPGGMTPMI